MGGSHLPSKTRIFDFLLCNSGDSKKSCRAMKLVGNCGSVIIRQDLGSTGGDVPLPLAVLYRFAELGAARQGQGRYRTTGLPPTHSLRFSSNNKLI